MHKQPLGRDFLEGTYRWCCYRVRPSKKRRGRNFVVIKNSERFDV